MLWQLWGVLGILAKNNSKHAARGHRFPPDARLADKARKPSAPPNATHHSCPPLNLPLPTRGDVAAGLIPGAHRMAPCAPRDYA